MNRVLGAVLVVVSFVVGYAASGSRLVAQGTMINTFPFTVGESVHLVFEGDNRWAAGDPCVIQGFSAPFVVCKGESDALFALNLTHVTKATLAKGQRDGR